MLHTSSLSVWLQFFSTLLLGDSFCNFLSNCHIASCSFPNLALEDKVWLDKIAALLAEIKKHHPLAVEVMSLEAELMKVQQPYLFG
jgi:hypothetical protein